MPRPTASWASHWCTPGGAKRAPRICGGRSSSSRAQLPSGSTWSRGCERPVPTSRAMAELGVVLAREPGNVRAWERAGDVARQQHDEDGAASLGARLRSWIRRHSSRRSSSPASILAAGRFDAALAALNPIADRAAENERIYELWCQALPACGTGQRCAGRPASWAGGIPVGRRLATPCASRVRAGPAAGSD